MTSPEFSDPHSVDTSDATVSISAGRGNSAVPVTPPALSVRMAASFARATSVALVSVDASGAISFVNHAAAEMFGHSVADMLGKPVEIIIPERFRQAHGHGFARAMAGAKLNTGGQSVEVYGCRKDGSEFPIELTLCAWHDDGDVGAGAVIKDISERTAREARLLRMASRDVLTGLHNRNGFGEALTQSLTTGDSIIVFMIDLDGFKDVNALHGHTVGDALLQAVAIRLRRALPVNAVVSRFGADEFAVMVTGRGEFSSVDVIAASLFAAFSVSFEIAGIVLHVGASMGVSFAPLHGSDAEELVACADFALRKATARGERAIEIYDLSMRDEAAATRAMRDELLVALRNGELELFYQPQVNMNTGVVFGCEALIRWNHPKHGLLLPGAFLPALEQSALAIEIGWWTLDRACRDAARIKTTGLSAIKMSVNLFPGQLHSPILRDKVVEALFKHGLSASDLELEITETTALRDDGKSLEAMNVLREIGVGIAFDDFGTGFASLCSLQRYPLTTLKIDRAFVRDLSFRPKDAAITRALISMSQDLGLETIAEGIETPDQEVLLKGLGCYAAQGYRFGKPMKLEALLMFLSSSLHY
jgi:diguanylate cyclase (GGDEF)-like protein/PAS domain S-box-containing protein